MVKNNKDKPEIKDDQIETYEDDFNDLDTDLTDIDQDIDGVEEDWVEDYDDDLSEEDQNTAAKPVPKKKTGKTVLLALGGIVALGAISFFAIGMFGSSQPKETLPPAQPSPDSLVSLKDKQTAEQTAALTSPTPETMPENGPLTPMPEDEVPQGIMEEATQPETKAVDQAELKQPTEIQNTQEPQAVLQEPAPTQESPEKTAESATLTPDQPKADLLASDNKAPAVANTEPVAPDLEENKPAETAKTQDQTSKSATEKLPEVASQPKVDLLQPDKAVEKDSVVEEKAKPIQKPAVSEKKPEKSAAPVVSAEPKAEPTSAPPASDSAGTKAPVPSASNAPIIWVLKGASPTRAILGEKGTNETRSVSIGDTVPSLGTITAIDQSATGWVVYGTTGKVSQ